MRSWWQKADLEALIDSQKKLSKGTKSTWDVGALEEVKDLIVAKEEKAQTSTEKELKSAKAEGVELVTGFQVGVGAKFYTFSPSQGDDKDNITIVRTKENKDPRGKIPIDWMYGDMDGSNPLGRSVIDLIGPLQNLIDSDMQMYQYNRALMLAPPVVKRGSFNKSRIRFAPNVIIDVGTDPHAKVEPLTIDTSAIQNYPALYGLQKSQLLNLVSSPDTSISAEIGNPGFSKTPQGVNAQQANISVDDNYIRKMFETWFENWSETAINLYFAERTGVEVIQLDEETADKLRDLAQEGKFDPSMLSDDNKIQIDYSSATPALKFEVDASSSKMQDDKKQQDGLTGLLTALDQSPVLAQTIPPDKIVALWNGMVNASGVEDPEKIKVDVKKFKQDQEQAQQTQQQAMQVQAQQPPPKQPKNLGETVQWKPADLTPIERAQALAQVGIRADLNQPPLSAVQTAQDTTLKADQQAHQQAMDVHQATQPQDPNAVQGQPLNETDQQIIQHLQAQGVPDDKIGQALAMLNHGMPLEDVMQLIAPHLQGAPA